jgi:hypothetical protein
MSSSSTAPLPLDRETLVQAILDLEQGGPALIPDPTMASLLAQRVKPYIDRLANPATEDEELEDREDEDESSLESLAEAIGLDEPGEEIGPRPPRPRPAPLLLEGPAPELAHLGPEDRARWIFLERFVPLERLQQILGYELTASDLARYREDLDRLLGDLLLLPPVAVAWAQNDVPALQRAFASTLLLLRHPFVGDAGGDPVPCTLRGLKERFPAYFYRRYRMPNWYEEQPLYTEPLTKARWIVGDVEYLNCTLRRPERKLAAYARQWFLTTEQVQQKSVIEDVYDRIICGEAVGEHLFERNCSSCTSTQYEPEGGGPRRTAFTVQKDGKISVHGKVGIPHWKASRRLWPGVFPMLVFP